MSDSLSDQDLEFLRRPLYAFFSAAAGPSPPQPRPVWFETAPGGVIQLFTGPDTVKMRQLRRDPRASLVVAAPVGERERWIAVSGHTAVERDGADDLLRRLAARYWDLHDPARAADLSQMLEQDWVRIVLHPDTVARYSM